MLRSSFAMSLSPVPLNSELGHQGNEDSFEDALPRLETDGLIDGQQE